MSDLAFEWVKTEERLPTEADGNRFGNVFVWRADGSHGCTDVVSVRFVQQYRVCYSHWSQIPDPEAA